MFKAGDVAAEPKVLDAVVVAALLALNANDEGAAENIG